MPVLRFIRSALVPAACLSLAAATLSASSGFARSAAPASPPGATAATVASGTAVRASSPWLGRYRLFPGAYFNPPEESPGFPGGAWGPARETGVPAEEPGSGEGAARTMAERMPLLTANQVLAFYGKPGAPTMGILGEYPKDKLAPLLDGYAKLYDAANGELGVIPAFYIIFGTCWPEGEIGYTRASVLEEYIAFAAERGWLVFLDHQIGKYTVESAVEKMLPYLKYPNVHLALDPEWRTLKPMKEIGSITGAEFNRAQEMIDAYLRDNGLPGIRMLVVHQFKPRMILDRETVRADIDRVVPVHTADGFGAPPLKRQAYRYNAEATNMPVKGFKLFFESKVPGAGWDSPLMRPEDVMTLEPVPRVIMYQ